MRFWVLLLLFVAAVSARGFRQNLSGGKPMPYLLHRFQEDKHRSIGNVTRNVRDCAANIAQKAAAEAKAAHAAQSCAGTQAAMVRKHLAEKALRAAKVAETALSGKQAIVLELQQEVKKAEEVVAEYTAAVQNQRATVNAAMQEAQTATAYHKMMCEATQRAAQLQKQAQCTFDNANMGLQGDCTHLSSAKSRLAHDSHKLECAIQDCAATKQSAHFACETARAACGNARKKKNANKQVEELFEPEILF